MPWFVKRLKVRIFNTYGTRMHPNDGRVVSNFIVQALIGKEITIYGDRSQMRSFIMPNLVKGIVNNGEIINQTGAKSKIVYYPLTRR